MALRPLAHASALSSRSCHPLASHPWLAACALLQALALGCAGEPQTTDSFTSGGTIGATSTGDSPTTTDATGETGQVSGVPATSTAEPTSDGPTTGAPATCADMCQRAIECGAPFTLEACSADCEATEPVLQGCVLACDQPVCEDLLDCTTRCNHPGDPNATPYADCAMDASHCLPEVYICIVTKHGDEQFSVCSPFCDENDQCPVPATGDAKPTCDVDSSPHTCSLDCSDGQQCPDEMTCDVESGICSWPVP